jgi:hypothetical protein
MIRTLVAAGLLVTLMAAPKAFAQGTAARAWSRTPATICRESQIGSNKPQVV